MNKFTIFFLLLILFNYSNSSSFALKGNVYYINIIQDFGAVSPSYSSYLKKNLQKIANDINAKAVIIKIDTPGGTVGDAEKIINYIQNSTVTTICFINNSAYSAGSFISLAADYIVMTQTAKIGAATPITIHPEKGPSSIKDKDIRAKIFSGLRASVRALADKRIKRLNREISKGKYPHLKNKNSVRNMEKILEAMIDKEIILTKEEHGYSLSNQELLTLTSKDAYELGVIDSINNNLNEILNLYNLKQYNLIKVEPSTGDQFLEILTNPIVISILMTIGMLGMIMEFWTPGWGVPGTIGILSLSLFFISQLAGPNPEWTALILFIIGVILLAIEIFVIPGFGIVGVSGILSILISFYLSLTKSSYSGSGVDTVLAIKYISISFLIILISLIIFINLIPKTKLFSKISLVQGEILSTSHDAINMTIIGKRGETVTSLRPSGVILIDGKRFDAITHGEFIDRGSKIEVIESSNNKIIVREC